MKKALIIFGIIIALLVAAGFFGWKFLSKRLNSMAADLDQKTAIVQACQGDKECITIVEAHYITCSSTEKPEDFKAFIMSMGETIQCISDKSGVDMTQYFE